MDIKKIQEQAKEELKEECFREAVEKEKQRLRTHIPLWDRVWPWKITIRRKHVRHQEN